MSSSSLAAAPLSSLAVLFSGGLDSAVLLAESAREYEAVFPLYIRFGLVWESVELDYLARFLQALSCPAVRPLTVLELPARALYQEHWSLSGADVPGAETPDEAVYLPGRNVLLLSLAMLWCHLHHVPAVALAPLANNPFPDATPAFFADFSRIVNRAMSGTVTVLQPFLHSDKLAVLKRGQGLPLEWTFSCLRPSEGFHCGVCNKCGERKKAFAAAGLSDPTRYARSLHV